MVAPFNTPPVPYTHWRMNKRAVAFQRSLFFLCVAQGILAMAKFFMMNINMLSTSHGNAELVWEDATSYAGGAGHLVAEYASRPGIGH